MKIKINNQWFPIDISTDERKVKAMLDLEDLMDLELYTEFFHTEFPIASQELILSEVTKYLMGLDYDKNSVLPESSDSVTELIVTDSKTGDKITTYSELDDYDNLSIDIVCGNYVSYSKFRNDELTDFDQKFTNKVDYLKYRESISKLIDFRKKCEEVNSRISTFFKELSKELSNSGIKIYYKSPELTRFNDIYFEDEDILKITESVNYFDTVNVHHFNP